MPFEIGWKSLKTYTSATAAEAAPTGGATFVTSDWYPGANAIEVAAIAWTKTQAADTGWVEIFQKTDVGGTAKVTPIDISALQVATGSTTVVSDAKTIDAGVGPGAFFSRLNMSTITGNVTGEVLFRPVTVKRDND